MNYNICPFCHSKLPAHKGHTMSFDQLTTTQQDRSIRIMAINLKKAILRVPRKDKINHQHQNIINFRKPLEKFSK